jgi:hypothetical protein
VRFSKFFASRANQRSRSWRARTSASLIVSTTDRESIITYLHNISTANQVLKRQRVLSRRLHVFTSSLHCVFPNILHINTCATTILEPRALRFIPNILVTVIISHADAKFARANAPMAY